LHSKEGPLQHKDRKANPRRVSIIKGRAGQGRFGAGIGVFYEGGRRQGGGLEKSGKNEFSLERGRSGGKGKAPGRREEKAQRGKSFVFKRIFLRGYW